MPPGAIGPYSQAVEVNGMVYTSGQIPVNPATGEIAGTIEGQARQVMENVKNLLAAAGATMDQVVKTTVFIKDMNDFGKKSTRFTPNILRTPARPDPVWR